MLKGQIQPEKFMSFSREPFAASLVVSAPIYQTRGRFKSTLGQKWLISAPLVALVNYPIKIRILTARCRWQDPKARKRRVKQPTYTEAKKMMFPTLQKQTSNSKTSLYRLH